MSMCSVEAIWMVMKSHCKTNIMFNPHRNNAAISARGELCKGRHLNELGGLFQSDSSKADDCIFIQTICFSLLIIYRLEMAMRATRYKVVCTYAIFFIHTLTIISFESRSRYNLAGNKSIKTLKYFLKGNILHQKARRKKDEGLPG